MPNEEKGHIYSSVVLAAIFAALSSWRGTGFIHATAVLALFVWIPYSIFVIYKQPSRGASQLARVAIWIGAVSLVAGIHYWRNTATWKNANEIVAVVNEFTAKHGHCPATLDEIGISPMQLREKIGYGGYGCRDGKPGFFFMEPYNGFDSWGYDFAAHSWVFHPD